MSIGSRIREARKARGISQKELADKIGIRQPSLSQLETGESQGTTYLARIASVLGVNPLWLETGKGARDAIELNSVGAGSAGSLNMSAETAKELQLLMVYRSANDREREALDDLVDGLRLMIEARARDKAQLAG